MLGLCAVQWCTSVICDIDKHYKCAICDIDKHYIFITQKYVHFYVGDTIVSSDAVAEEWIGVLHVRNASGEQDDVKCRSLPLGCGDESVSVPSTSVRRSCLPHDYNQRHCCPNVKTFDMSAQRSC